MRESGKENPRAAARSSAYRFLNFYLYPSERQLHQGSKLIPLQPKTFDVLLALVRNAGSLVLRDRLVNEVWPTPDLLPRARFVANEIMQNSPSSVRATKALLLSYVKDALDRQVGQAVADNARIRTTQDFHEGIASFLEKRKPKWSGK